MFKKIFQKTQPDARSDKEYKMLLMPQASASWSGSSYNAFSSNYVRNVIVNRCISMLASNSAFITPIFNANDGVENLFRNPNNGKSSYQILEEIYSYKLIYGNAYVLFKYDGDNLCMCTVRPERIMVLSGNDGEVSGYRYTFNGQKMDYNIGEDRVSNILHIKDFNPINDYYGLSPMEPAKYSIDQHFESSSYTKALLQNSARPSGALLVKPTDDSTLN